MGAYAELGGKKAHLVTSTDWEQSESWERSGLLSPLSIWFVLKKEAKPVPLWPFLCNR